MNVPEAAPAAAKADSAYLNMAIEGLVCVGGRLTVRARLSAACQVEEQGIHQLMQTYSWSNATAAGFQWEDRELLWLSSFVKMRMSESREVKGRQCFVM